MKILHHDKNDWPNNSYSSTSLQVTMHPIRTPQQIRIPSRITFILALVIASPHGVAGRAPPTASSANPQAVTLNALYVNRPPLAVGSGRGNDKGGSNGNQSSSPSPPRGGMTDLITVGESIMSISNPSYIKCCVQKTLLFLDHYCIRIPIYFCSEKTLGWK